MALHWDISKCKNMEALQEEANGEWAITNALIWTTMHTDMGSITEKNAALFYARTKVVELFGTLLRKYNEETDEMYDYPISFGDIEKRIGLSTNVSTTTVTQFLKRMEKAGLRPDYQITSDEIKAAYYGALVTVAQQTKGENNE